MIIGRLSDWNVNVNDKSKSSYGTILSKIAGKNVSYMTETFKNCVNLVESPAIPATILQLDFTFSGCTNLKHSPTIP